MKIVKTCESGYLIRMNRESIYYQRFSPDTTSQDPLTIQEDVITHLCETLLNIDQTERKRLRELVDAVWSHVNEDESVPSTSTADKLIYKVFNQNEETKNKID